MTRFRYASTPTSSIIKYLEIHAQELYDRAADTPKDCQYYYDLGDLLYEASWRLVNLYDPDRYSK